MTRDIKWYIMRGVRVVEGADLERLCGVTHRGFESLPLSHRKLPTQSIPLNNVI